MRDSYFLTTNLAESASILNGTGGGNPATIEDAGFAMSNLLDGQRSTSWKYSAASGSQPLKIRLDLGSSVAVTLFGLTGYTPLGGLLTDTLDAEVLWCVTPTGTYVSAGSLSFNLSGTPERDASVLLNATTARYWEIQLDWGASATDAAEIMLAGLWLGEALGMGTSFRARSPHRRRRARRIVETPDGSIVTFDSGKSLRAWDLGFSAIDDATHAVLESVVDAGHPVLWYAPNGETHEVVVDEDGMTSEPVFDDLWDASLTLRGLP